MSPPPGIANYIADPVFRGLLERAPEEELALGADAVLLGRPYLGGSPPPAGPPPP